jgi:AcrR family transcriptional regulator
MQDPVIPEEKRQRIIRSGMENFAKKGYKKATMDEIVADAGISKGLIFHYYGNKKKLFWFLYEFAYGFVYEQLVPRFNLDQLDLFERIRQSEGVKLAVVREYPYSLDFLLAARREEDEEFRTHMKRVSRESFPSWSETFLKGIDTTKLREGIELDRVIKIILWCTNGLLAEHKDNFVLEDVFAEMDIYLNLMRKAFYKDKEEFQ